MNADKQKEIYENYYQKVLRYLVSKVNDTYLAEDLCSDIFLKIYEKYDSFNSEKASLSTWIYTVARNYLTDYYRSRRVFEEVPEDIEAEGSIEDDICNEETLNELADALEKLDERARKLIILRYYSGHTLKDIGQELGISYAYVKILHNKALGELRMEL